MGPVGAENRFAPSHAAQKREASVEDEWPDQQDAARSQERIPMESPEAERCEEITEERASDVAHEDRCGGTIVNGESRRRKGDHCPDQDKARCVCEAA